MAGRCKTTLSSAATKYQKGYVTHLILTSLIVDTTCLCIKKKTIQKFVMVGTCLFYGTAITAQN